MYSTVITVMYEKIFISCHMINTSVGFTLKHATSLPDDLMNSCFKYETERSSSHDFLYKWDEAILQRQLEHVKTC